MDEVALIYCHDCKNKKPKPEFKLHSKDTKHAKKGNPLRQCLPCGVKQQERRQRNKRKHDEDITMPSMPSESQGSIIPIERFTELLAELAQGCEIDYRTYASRQRMVEEEEGIFKLIVKHVWEATGYRFTYVWLLLEV
jgi:hypothetical protein